MTKYYEELGANIRRTRRLKEVHSTDLAKHLGVDPKTVQRYENGKIRLLTEISHRIASYLGVSINALLPEIHTPKKNAKSKK
jgi:transcriptional regulator with XRE-family HTH domain